MSEAGQKLWECVVRYVLVHGPRKSGKSLAILDRILKHAIQNPGADICILTRVLSKGEAGVWKELTKPGGAIERWIKAGITKYYAGRRKGQVGYGYMPGSKVPYAKLVTSGAPSTIQLHTLDNDENVEDKFKDMTFSMVYMVEADSFERNVFTTMQLCLRSSTVKFERQQMLLDMNPPPEGEDHWAYKFFIANPQPNTTAIQFPLSGNKFISEEEKQGVFEAYAHDSIKLARLFHGQWVKTSESCVFSEVLSEDLHFVGDPIGATDAYNVLDEREILRPDSQCYQLDVGWDIGDQNTAVVLAAPRRDGGDLCYDVIDEVVKIRRRVSLKDIVDQVVEMLDYWEEWLRRENGVKQVIVKHYSDSSSMNFKAAISGSEAMHVRLLTEGRINLMAVPKGSGSVERRADMLKRLLFENKIAISSRCLNTQAMLRYLRPRVIIDDPDDEERKAKIIEGVDKYSQHKHTFDALTYNLGSCLPQYLIRKQSTAPQSRSARGFATMALA